MKKVLFFINLSLLVGCTSSKDMGMTQSLAARMLNQECHDYLSKQKLWHLAQLTLGAQAQDYKIRVCDCASVEAAKRMSTSQFLQLANERTRTNVLIEVIPPTVATCYQQLVH